MASGRYYGRVGFGKTVEVRSGVWEDVIVERKLYGDILRPSRSFNTDEKVIPDTRLGNRVSVLADNDLLANIDAIRFVEFRGNLWTVSRMEEQPPRLILSLGEVYHGPVGPTGTSE